MNFKYTSEMNHIPFMVMFEAHKAGIVPGAYIKVPCGVLDGTVVRIETYDKWYIDSEGWLSVGKNRHEHAYWAHDNNGKWAKVVHAPRTLEIINYYGDSEVDIKLTSQQLPQRTEFEPKEGLQVTDYLSMIVNDLSLDVMTRTVDNYTIIYVNPKGVKFSQR